MFSFRFCSQLALRQIQRVVGVSPGRELLAPVSQRLPDGLSEVVWESFDSENSKGSKPRRHLWFAPVPKLVSWQVHRKLIGGLAKPRFSSKAPTRSSFLRSLVLGLQQEMGPERSRPSKALRKISAEEFHSCFSRRPPCER